MGATIMATPARTTFARASSSRAFSTSARAEKPSPTDISAFNKWVKGDGARYRFGVQGRPNWIGGETPFPLNPAFKPLPPLPDTLKTRIYNAFIYNIENHPNVTSDAQVVRAVAAKFGVAMDRVRAIVRLKELEKTMRAEGKPVESNFQKGMEAHLGVKAAASENWRGIEAPDAGRGSRVSQASHKTVFEFVDAEQGDKPVLPLLDKLPTRSRTDEAGQRRQVERDSTSIYPPARPGRPATLFRDLSGTPEGIALETTYSVKGKRTRRAGANRRSLETDVLDKYGVTVRSAMDGAVRKQATDPRHRAQLVAEAIARASEKGQEFKST